VAQYRLILAKELYHMLGPAATFLVKQAKAAGSDPADVEVPEADVLLYIASQLHIYAVGVKAQAWLPRVDVRGQDLSPPAGAEQSGVERSANTTTIGECVKLQVYVEQPAFRDCDFIWGRVIVLVRGELGSAAGQWTRPYTTMPSPEASVADTPSWLAARKTVAEADESRSRGVHLQHCFERLRRGEVLDKDNMWYCGHCKEHVQAEKRLEIWSLPDFLILQLKRFE
jgi:hypothetical protein